MLNTREWKPFVIDDIFITDKGTYLNKKNILNGDIPYITAKFLDNGVNDFIGNQPLFSKNSITIEKIKLSAYYQPHDFYCSHDVSVIQSENLNKYTSLFVCTMIKRQGVKYSYGRQAQLNVVKREIVFLPIDENNTPDWKFMEDYMIELEERKRVEYLTFVKNKLKHLKFKKIESLDVKEWKEFSISKLFTVKIGTSIDGNKIDKTSGETPYITRKENNNGLDGFIENEEIKMTKNYPVITIGNETAQPYVQQYPFYTGTKVNVLTPIKDLSEYILFFISTCLRQQKSKYNYSFTINSTRLKKQTILLPINDKDEPDYEYMEQYIKNLMFKKYNQYLKSL